MSDSCLVGPLFWLVLCVGRFGFATTPAQAHSWLSEVEEVYKISLFLDPLIHGLVVSYLHFASIVGSIFFDPLEIVHFSRGSKHGVIVYTINYAT